MSAFGGTKFGGVFQNQVEVVKASMRIKLYFNNKHYKEMCKKCVEKEKNPQKASQHLLGGNRKLPN